MLDPLCGQLFMYRTLDTSYPHHIMNGQPVIHPPLKHLYENSRMGLGFVLLYVHLKRDTFPSPVTFVHTKVAPPSLTNFVIYPLCFLTAYKSCDVLPVLSGTSDSKSPTHTSICFVFY